MASGGTELIVMEPQWWAHFVTLFWLCYLENSFHFCNQTPLAKILTYINGKNG